MRITIELVGFSEDRPPVFGKSDVATLDFAPGARVADALARAGVDGEGLACLINGTSLPRASFECIALADRDRITVLHALEGG